MTKLESGLQWISLDCVMSGPLNSCLTLHKSYNFKKSSAFKRDRGMTSNDIILALFDSMTKLLFY